MNAIVIPATVALVTSLIGSLVLLTPMRHMGQRFASASTGFCAGVMLGAAVFTLILPSITQLSHFSAPNRVALIVLAMAAGYLLMEGLHQSIPHQHVFKGREGLSGDQFRRSVLIVAAIALHNIPEGIALGAGYMQPDRQAADSLLFGIGLQNLPEGLIVAIALAGIGLSRLRVLLGVALTAISEAFGALFGSLIGNSLEGFLPFTLLVCSAAMIYVVSQEMIPESHRSGHERLATLSLFIGFVGILGLTTL